MNLHYSQTKNQGWTPPISLKNYMNLHYSQTKPLIPRRLLKLKNYMNLHYSQTFEPELERDLSA